MSRIFNQIFFSVTKYNSDFRSCFIFRFLNWVCVISIYPQKFVFFKRKDESIDEIEFSSEIESKIYQCDYNFMQSISNDELRELYFKIKRVEAHIENTNEFKFNSGCIDLSHFKYIAGEEIYIRRNR